jgi:Tfp pilus assembly protein FimT
VTRERGSSLIEVLIATSVGLTLLGMGLPRLARMRSPYAIDGAARQIAAAVQVARQRALARNASYRMNFDASARTYAIQRANGGTWVNEADLPTQTLPTGVQIGTVSPNNPVFTARGTLAQQVTVPLTITGARSRTVTINVLGKTIIN